MEYKNKCKYTLKSGFDKTTKQQIAEIMFNFAMRLCEDNQEEAIKLIESERSLVVGKTKRELSFWYNWR